MVMARTKWLLLAASLVSATCAPPESRVAPRSDWVSFEHTFQDGRTERVMISLQGMSRVDVWADIPVREGTARIRETVLSPCWKVELDALAKDLGNSGMRWDPDHSFLQTKVTWEQRGRRGEAAWWFDEEYCPGMCARRHRLTASADLAVAVVHCRRAEAEEKRGRDALAVAAYRDALNAVVDWLMKKLPRLERLSTGRTGIYEAILYRSNRFFTEGVAAHKEEATTEVEAARRFFAAFLTDHGIRFDQVDDTVIVRFAAGSRAGWQNHVPCPMRESEALIRELLRR